MTSRAGGELAKEWSWRSRGRLIDGAAAGASYRNPKSGTPTPKIRRPTRMHSAHAKYLQYFKSARERFLKNFYRFVERPTALTRKIFMIFQTALLRKPECDEGQYHDDVKRNCSWAQDDRSKF
jgi:hypothetical protein